MFDVLAPKFRLWNDLLVHTEDLEAFFAVASEGSLSRAGKALELPKSTVSRRISRLEEELGTLLLVRSPRQTQLTEMGALLFERGSPALARLEEIRRWVVDRGAVPRGPLRVSAPPDLTAAHLGGLCARFGLAHPEVELTLIGTNALSRVLDGDCDVALRVHMEDLPAVTALRMRTLATFRLALYASSNYLASRPELTRVEQLEGCARLSLDALGARWRLVHADTGARHELEGTPALRSNDHLLLIDAATAGAGVVILPSFLAEPKVHSGALAPVLPEWGGRMARVSLLWLASAHTSPRVRAFVYAAIEYLDPPPWHGP